MAEWAPPTSRPPRSPPTLPRLPPPPFENEESKPNARVIVPQETYVVQVQKDQIYRVPPPENARIAEMYRNNHKKSQKRNPCLVCIGWTLGAALLLFVLLLIVSVLFYVVVGPAKPLFTVGSLAAKGTGSKLQFNVGMTVENPSKMMGVRYKYGGKANLMYKSTRIADGKTPKLYQDAKENNPLALILHGSNTALPKTIDNSLHGKSKGVIALELKIDLVVNFNVGGLELWDMSFNTLCDVQARGLTNKTQIVSQECKSKLG